MPRTHAPPTLTRRAFLRRAAAGLSAGALLAACGAPQAGPAPAPAAQPPAATATPSRTITVWYWDESIAELVESFRQASPGIGVRIESNGDIEPGLLRALRGGSQVPDVCAFGSGLVPELSAAGGMLDLAAAPFDGAALEPQFVPSAWAGGRSAEGRLVGMPLNVYPGSFWYRADLLEAAGIESDPAALQERVTSWDALLTLAQDYRRARPDSALFADASEVFYTIWSQQGGAWLDGTKIVIEERFAAAAQQAALVRQQELDADLLPSQSSWNSAMRDDAIAGLFAPSWFQGYISDIHFNQVGKWRVIRAPGGDFSQGAAYLGIPEGAAQQEAAWTFVRYCCATPEGQNKLLSSSGDFPAYTPAWQDPLHDAPVSFFGDQPVYRLWAEIAAAAPVPSSTQHDRAMFEILDRHVRRMIRDGGDPAQALRDAEAEIAQQIPSLTT